MIVFHKLPHRTKRDWHRITPFFEYYMGLAAFCYSDYNHYNRRWENDCYILWPLANLTKRGSGKVAVHSDVTLNRAGHTTFYLGGYGAFDSLAASVLRKQKKRYPQIELVLVLAYLKTRQDISYYDSTVYPPLEAVPRRFAISYRNRWMVESTDVIVAYVLHDWGGAATTLQYAKQKKKPIISFADR